MAAPPPLEVTEHRAQALLRELHGVALSTAKVHLKMAGCFRTRDGAERFALLRGLVETARQRQWPFLDFLRLGPEAARPQPSPP